MSPPDDPLLRDAPAAGSRFGRWRLDVRLGQGGYGAVWRAERDDGVLAALKLVDVSAVGTDALPRVNREHEVLSRLDHPGVVRALDFGHDGTFVWLALEYVDGEDLESRVRAWAGRRKRDDEDPTTEEALADGPPPSRFVEVERIFRALCEALAHVHTRGWVHRDVKPANVLLGRDGAVKLTDFGVVVGDEVSRNTVTGHLVGTIAYMAPEQIAEQKVDARADLYGLGAVLYSMLTLRRPIEADTVAGYLARHLTTMPTPPHELDPTVPVALDRVCMRLLEKEPERRFPSARDALAALDRAESGVPVVHGREDAVDAWRERVSSWQRGSGGGLFLVEGPVDSGRTTLLRHLAALARLTEDTLPDGRKLVFVDDLDAVGPVARRAADDAIRDGHLVTATVSPGYADRDGPDPTRVALTELPRRAIGRLLRDLGVPTAPATVLAQRMTGDGAWPGAVVAQVEALILAGWLAPDGPTLRMARPLSSFRDDVLPVPARVRVAVLAAYAELDDDARELVDLLAVHGRPTSATLLARASSSPVRVPVAVDRLVTSGWLTAEPGDEDVALGLRQPAASAVVRGAMARDTLQARHLALAQALGRRRRRASAEVAEHLAAGGRPDDAVGLFAAAARAHLDGGAPDEALRVADQGVRTLVAATEVLPAAELERVRRTLQSVRGTALMQLGRWPEAVPALEHALEIARLQGDRAAIARSAASFGRVLYRLGRHARAAPVLEEALDHADDPAVTAAARRALADIQLQRGNLDVAMTLLRAALDDAARAGVRDAEARARRGVAHVFGLEGRYAEAAAELEHADELLVPDGDPNVRIGILFRAIDLDLAAGRYGLAIQRTDQLVDLLHAGHRSDRLADALADAAVIHRILGHPTEAETLARRALLLARPAAARAWYGVVRAVRVLDALTADDEAAALAQPELLDTLTAITRDDAGVHVPAGQAHAVLARLLSRTDPERARGAVAAALAARPAPWGLSQIQRDADLAIACARLGDVSGAHARVDAIAALAPPERGDGILLDIAQLRTRLDGTPPVGARALVDRISAQLPPRVRAGFLARPDIGRLIAAGDAPDPGPTR